MKIGRFAPFPCSHPSRPPQTGGGRRDWYRTEPGSFSLLSAPWREHSFATAPHTSHQSIPRFADQGWESTPRMNPLAPEASAKGRRPAPGEPAVVEAFWNQGSNPGDADISRCNPSPRP